MYWYINNKGIDNSNSFVNEAANEGGMRQIDGANTFQ